MTTGASSLPHRRTLGRYELVAQIGEGGMAEVHLARQRGPRQFEKLVVVKTVRPSLATRPEVAALLLEEARIAALVKHPNVVDIYDLGEENGTFFIAMEYLEGEALSNVLRVSRHGPRLDPFSTARIVADCASGLHAAHELRSMAGDHLELVHQDVTPGNVIVLYDGQVKLVDFGVAKVRTSVDDGTVKGKTGYLAPELLAGAPADRRSDIWSLGVVLWESLTLRRLFHAATETEALARIRAGEVPPPSSLSSSVPRDLDDVVFKALARDPRRRYETAEAMHADLMQILRHASWSGGNEPIARFMRSVFVDRIAARRDLLRELALGRGARAATLERLQAIRDEGSSSSQGGVVVGSHGAGSRPVHAPLPLAAPPPEPDNAAMVELADIEIDAESSPAAIGPPRMRVTPLPTTRIPRLRRKVAAFAIAGGALVGAIGAAMAIGMRSSDESAAVTIDAGVRSAADHQLPAVAVVTPDAAVEAMVEVDAAVEEPQPAVVVKHHGKTPIEHEHEHDHDHGHDPVVAPVVTETSAKGLYKAGLQKFVEGDAGAAIALFEQARHKDSGYAPAYRGLGMAYEKRGDAHRAARAFETYLKLAPDASDASSIRTRLERLR